MASILVLSFFPAFTPPSSGGELRLGNFYRTLSRFHDVTMLTSTDFDAQFEEVLHTSRMRELRFPKDRHWSAAYATLERSGLRGELSGLAFALAVSEPSCELRLRARLIAESVDLVIHDFPYSEPIFADGCPRPEIYNSHNFEVTLLSSIVRGNGFEEALLKLIRLEGNLVSRAQRVFAVSDEDAEKFRLFYGVNTAKMGICPNGIDLHDLGPIAADRQLRGPGVSVRPKLSFIGSAHHPNVEAAEFLIKLALELPECDLLLAGAVCNSLATGGLPRNLRLLGVLDPLSKSRHLSEIDLFLNPVVLGSGTSLKALEALGAAVPIVSTPEGVRGLKLQSGVHCEVIARPGFAATVRRLMAEPATRSKLAAAGLALVQAEYSWDRIAAQFDAKIASPMQNAFPTRPLVLALNDYPVLQRGSGGIARIRGLLANLDVDVVLLSFGAAFDVGVIAPGVLHATLPKTPTHRAFEAAMNDGQPMSVNDGVASLFAGSSQALTALTCAVARRAQAVIFEHPYMAPMLDPINAVRPDLPVIYSAHNVEATHKREVLHGHRLVTTLATFIAELERRIVARANLIVCCTESDAQHFAAETRRILVVPNGCVLPDDTSLTAARQTGANGSQPRLGFMASAHGPNVEAGLFIVQELAPTMPEVQFELIGSVCGALPDSLPANVVLHGMVDETAKTSIMAGWHIALNPVQSGGGSSLKLPDYMAHALASLSTPTGARGLPIAQHDAGYVVERGEFRDRLRGMLGERDVLSRLQANARRYAVERLTWSAITSKYRQALHELIVPPAALSECGKLLVVTYRYTEPALGGAEEYLIEILKRLRPRYSRVDLAAIDVDQLSNFHHFGCRMSTLEGGAARRLGQLFDNTKFFRPDEVAEAESFDRARNLERAWTHEEPQLLSPFIAELSRQDRLGLFGGFYLPENHNGTIRRWTSPKFSFLAPKQARCFRISGYAATGKTLVLTLMQVTPGGDVSVLAQYRQMLLPTFSATVALPKARSNLPFILGCEVEEHVTDQDPRPFGILLSSASVLIDDLGAFNDAVPAIAALQEIHADLSEQYDEELRIEEFDRWISALYDNAQRRDAAIEADFAAVRGPHARDMYSWIAAHAHEYDVVLVQGIPFDVLPSTVEALSHLPRRPRVVTLPHFHGDDRFYYWRRYLDSFSAADATLIFSSSIAEHLKAPGRRLQVLPGGGIRPDEHGDPTAEYSFRKVHRQANPFFLVLGRKTASKHYEEVIRAQQLLRRSGREIDLVIIGPDEDGRPIDGAGVHYLGRQPRDVIRGALRTCLALVTMSRSESFGIVLCEAWLFGKPVIASRACYAFRELVKHGETGLLVKTEPELAEAMRQLAIQPLRRSRLGRAGFLEVISRFTWEQVANSCIEALTQTTTDHATSEEAEGRVSPVFQAGRHLQTAEPKLDMA